MEKLKAELKRKQRNRRSAKKKAKDEDFVDKDSGKPSFKKKMY